MKTHLKNLSTVFFTAYIQVFLIIAQTKFVIGQETLLVAFAAMGISTCWLFNVNGVIKTTAHKIGYVLGCVCGSASSMYLINMLMGFL